MTQFFKNNYPDNPLATVFQKYLDRQLSINSLFHIVDFPKLDFTTISSLLFYDELDRTIHINDSQSFDGSTDQNLVKEYFYLVLVAQSIEAIDALVSDLVRFETNNRLITKKNGFRTCNQRWNYIKQTYGDHYQQSIKQREYDIYKIAREVRHFAVHNNQLWEVTDDSFDTTSPIFLEYFELRLRDTLNVSNNEIGYDAIVSTKTLLLFARLTSLAYQLFTAASKHYSFNVIIEKREP